MNRLDAMHLFVCIVESGSFTAVAELMGLDRIENNDGLESAKDAMIQIINALMQGPDGKPREDTTGD